MGTLDFDFRDPELHVDPLTYQRRFAEAEPVHRNSQGLWVLTRYADVLAMLRDERVSTDRRNLYRNKLDPSRPYLTHVEHNLFYRSGDDHRRLRAPLSRAFTPRALASFEAEVATRARSLAAGLDPGASTWWPSSPSHCRWGQSPRCWGCPTANWTTWRPGRWR